MTPARRRAWAASILGSLVAAIACSEPTAPEAPAGPIAEPLGGPSGSASLRGDALAARPGASAPASAAVSDASDRILASLNSDAAAELRRTLEQLKTALSTFDRSQTRRLLPQAYQTLRTIGSSDERGLGPELSAIELALDAARRELEAWDRPAVRAELAPRPKLSRSLQ